MVAMEEKLLGLLNRATIHSGNAPYYVYRFDQKKARFCHLDKIAFYLSRERISPFNFEIADKISL